MKTQKNTIVLATNNAGKIKELSAILVSTSLPYNLVSQKELKITTCPEHGLTFVENAIAKARHACQHSGHAAIADDSGLVVDALNGAPGIHSARYASSTNNESSNSADNITKLLTELQNTTKRSAHFYCIIVYLRHATDPAPIICQGVWEGEILTTPQGKNGFGYDPIFWIEKHSCSAAELLPEIKNRISHRAQAMQQLISALQ